MFSEPHPRSDIISDLRTALHFPRSIGPSHADLHINASRFLLDELFPTASNYASLLVCSLARRSFSPSFSDLSLVSTPRDPYSKQSSAVAGRKRKHARAVAGSTSGKRGGREERPFSGLLFIASLTTTGGALALYKYAHSARLSAGKESVGTKHTRLKFICYLKHPP